LFDYIYFFYIYNVSPESIGVLSPCALNLLSFPRGGLKVYAGAIMKQVVFRYLSKASAVQVCFCCAHHHGRRLYKSDMKQEIVLT